MYTLVHFQPKKKLNKLVANPKGHNYLEKEMGVLCVKSCNPTHYLFKNVY